MSKPKGILIALSYFCGNFNKNKSLYYAGFSK